VLFAQREGVVVEDLGVCKPKNKARPSFWAVFRLEAISRAYVKLE